jgi:hypothetical protein
MDEANPSMKKLLVDIAIIKEDINGEWAEQRVGEYAQK